MAEFTPIAAERRERAGKGAARATRRAGRVPAVIYGNKQDPVMISVDPVELKKLIQGGAFFSRVYEINVDGDKHRTLARDLQQHPVTDAPIHVDFMRFSATTRVNVDVQVIFENEEMSPGLKRGGALNVVRHQIELICKPDAIPEQITVDVGELEIGDSVHISDVSIPEDAELTITDRDFTIATIAAPSALAAEEEEEEAAEGEEGEVAEGEEGEVAEGEGEAESAEE